MNPKQKYLLLSVAGLGLIALLVWVLQDWQGVSWRETYKMEGKNPYDLSAAYQLLAHYTEAESLIEVKDSLAGQLPENNGKSKPSNYLYIGEGLFMRPQDRDALLHFVEAGNTAFIAAKILPFDLMFYLYYDECDSEPWDGLAALNDSIISLNFTHPALAEPTAIQLTYLLDYAPALTYWNYFSNAYFCDKEEMTPIGMGNNDMVNMVQIRYGEGYFYLHSQPKVFTNLFMLQTEGRRYIEKTLSHLNNGPIYWDEYSRIPEQMARNMNNAHRSQPLPNHLNSQHPLQYIQEQPPLAWAWYLLVGLALIFMLFRTKRRQRVMPIQPEKKNTSLQFLQTISWLSFQESGHQQLAIQAIQLFRSHIKERYGLAWRNDDPFFVQQLSNRSGINEDLIKNILKDCNNIPKYTGLVETELVKFHKRLERFYQQAK